MPFQTRVNRYPAPAVEGDFASANPRTSTLAGEGGLVAGTSGVTIGRFAWIDIDDRRIANNFATSTIGPDGFVHRDQQGIIPNYLEEESMIVPKGFAVTLHNEGDFWAMNYGPDASAINGQVYADLATGKPLFTPTAPPPVATGTASIGATFSAGGSGNNLVVTAVAAGVISVGDTLGTVTGIPAGTTITGQVSGTPGGIGTYTTNNPTTVDGTVTSFGNVLNVTALTSGNLQVGDLVTGTGYPTGTHIIADLGANGGVGQYEISVPATAYLAAAAFSVTGAIGTNFIAKTVGAVGELVKISTWGKQ